MTGTPATKLLIKRLSEKAKLPTRGSALSAGYDLYRYVDSIASFGAYRRVFLSLIRVVHLQCREQGHPCQRDG